MRTFTEEITLETISCGQCGGVHALNKTFLDHAKLYSGTYYCPYCKTGWGWKETEADRLRKQLSESKCDILRKQQLLEAEQKAREAVEQKLRRVHHGVCPCCKRSFANLARHMATKHPKP